MNWEKVKEVFPNTWEELKKLGNETNLDGRTLLEEFCERNGIKYGLTIIKPMKDYDSKKNSSN